MAKNNNLGDFLTDIANAIRTKKGTSGTIPAQDFSSEILSIQGGGGGGMTYEDYARTLYLAWGQSRIFPNAWQHNLEVDITEIEKNSTTSTQYGKLQYPEGDLFGVIIPEGTTKIGNWAFYDWESNNQPLVIPNSVTSIGGGVFQNWKANTHPLVIPNSVTSIGSVAFDDWRKNNKPLVIPDSVTSIGSNTFRYWLQVPYVEIKAVIPPSLGGSNAFNNQNNAPIYVPDESLDDYKTATNWVGLASRIFPISEKP